MPALNISKARFVQLLILAVMGWYLLLVTLHYFNQRPLWNDEDCVFDSIKNYSPAFLFTHPLSHGQQFPRFHVYVIQWLSSHFDFSLLSLRFLSFVFMVTAFLIWMRLGVKQLAHERQRLAFALCWAGSIPLIYYGAELKPYSMDVCAASLFLLFLSKQEYLCRRHPSLHTLMLILLPWLAVWSYTAFLMFVFPFFNVLRMRGETLKRDLSLYMASGVTVLALVYWFDLRVSNAGELRTYWAEYYVSFHSVGSFLGTTFEGINNLICRWFAEQPHWIRMAARFFVAFGIWEMIAGFKSQLKKDGLLFSSVGSVALIVFVELFLLGALHRYPFSVPRMSLFFAPMILFLAVRGFERLGKFSGLVRIIFMVYLVFISVGIAGVIFQGDMGAQSPISWKIP